MGRNKYKKQYNRPKVIRRKNANSSHIRVDESYLEQILNFLQQIPKNKREIFQHTKLDISPKTVKEDNFLTILANGPTISTQEANEWEQQIREGYKSWNIKEF